MSAQLQEFIASYGNVVDLCLLNTLLAYGVWLSLSVNMFTLGTGGFMSVGAYSSVFLTMQVGIPFELAVLAGGLLAGLAALAIGIPVLRLRGDYFMLATFAFTEVVRIIALNWDSLTGGAIGIVGIPRQTQTWQLMLLVAITIFFALTLRSGYLGRAIAAVRQDEVMTQVMGVNVFAYRLSLFVAGAFIGGVAGALAAHLNYFIGPADFGLLRSVDALTYPILGGFNALLGPLVGAIFTTLLPEALRFSSQWREILMGILVIFVVLFLPGGAMSLLPRGGRHVNSVAASTPKAGA
jgi:branched-chain amino acid transport system permease protein